MAVLPPYGRSPAASRSDVSPYRVTLVEVCERWGTTLPRREILVGLLALRGALRALGITQGFQWLDGSFVEDVETTRGRPPGDIDVVTFFVPAPFDLADPAIANIVQIITDRAATKAVFRTDHFLVPLTTPPELLVDDVRYLGGLFSHRRADDVWKGMLRIDFDNAADDVTAQQRLAAAALANP
jgi:hypothetical protein